MYSNEFFIIDSNNLNHISENIYGYFIDSSGLINKDILNNLNLTGFGAYVLVNVNENEIRIKQDFIGAYGLYIYQNKNYFAISNSFIQLVNYLKKSQELSFNEDYAKSFLFSELCSIAYKETLINEIKTLPRNFEIKIDKKDKFLKFNEINYFENTIPVNSKEGIEILDKWFNKWVNYIRNICEKTNNIQLHLSGGIDSRLILGLFLKANVDLTKIKIVSVNDNKHVHTEDFRIASKIAKHFNFQLNKSVFCENKIYYDNIIVPIMNSFNLKLGFHKEMYFKLFKYEKPIYTFTGSGGECIRGYIDKNPEEYIEFLKENSRKYDESLINSNISIIKTSLNELYNEFDIDINSKDIIERHYKEVRCRHHFGKSAIETFFSNEFSIMPLIDPDLYKLKLTTSNCDDKNLLIALIFTRYFPELLNFEFEGNRKINQNTIKYANKINVKFKFEKMSNSFISGPILNLNNIKENEEFIKRSDIDNFLENIFYSQYFEIEFKKYFSSKSYDGIHNIIKNYDYYPLRSVYAAISILKISKDVSYSNYKNQSEIDWLESYLDSNNINNKFKYQFNKSLNKYSTARIDVKNFGCNNNIEIVEISDSNVNCYEPHWFNDKKGIGHVIESNEGILDFKIKCVNSGNLKIYLRGVDFKVKNGEKFPIYINYNMFYINGEKILENKLIWHDKPFIFEKNVENNEILKIHIEWCPVNKLSEFNNTLKILNSSLKNNLKNMEKDNILLQEKFNEVNILNKNLKIELDNVIKHNQQLENKMDEIIMSNSWKLTSFLRKFCSFLKRIK